MLGFCELSTSGSLFKLVPITDIVLSDDVTVSLLLHGAAFNFEINSIGVCLRKALLYFRVRSFRYFLLFLANECELAHRQFSWLFAGSDFTSPATVVISETSLGIFGSACSFSSLVDLLVLVYFYSLDTTSSSVKMSQWRIRMIVKIK